MIPGVEDGWGGDDGVRHGGIAPQETARVQPGVPSAGANSGNNGWYWEVITESREILGRGVNGSLDAAAAQAERAAQEAAKQLQKQTPFA